MVLVNRIVYHVAVKHSFCVPRYSILYFNYSKHNGMNSNMKTLKVFLPPTTVDSLMGTPDDNTIFQAIFTSVCVF